MLVAGRFLDRNATFGIDRLRTLDRTFRPDTRSSGTYLHYCRIIEHCRECTEQAGMSANKKSSLTGYLPDILMAAAAVRPFPPTRPMCSPHPLHPSLPCRVHSDIPIATDSLLRHPQPPRTPRPRSSTKRRGPRQSLGRNPQTRRYPHKQTAKKLWRIRQ
jgi:hypothetical protein